MITQHHPSLPRNSVTRRGALDPLDRFSEIFFGLLMALTFTCTISVAEAGRAEVRTLLIAALGCNLAWGFVDAVMYVIARSAERIRNFELGKLILAAPDRATARSHLMEGMPEPFDSLMDDESLDRVIDRIRETRSDAEKPLITREDIKGAIAVFFLVALSTFPVVLPFLFTDQVQLAMRLSNATAIFLLFILGLTMTRYSKQKSLWLSLGMVGIGVVLTLTTIALGG
ncbi:MAG TPA: VIT1/CCC1 transporter family protein [bacterium]|nr:VIT1/CCC1 transporter family protein [bacterium]